MDLEKKNILELEFQFHLNFFKELEFHELEYFTWNLSPRKNSISIKELEFHELEFQKFFFLYLNFISL